MCVGGGGWGGGYVKYKEIWENFVKKNNLPVDGHNSINIVCGSRITFKNRTNSFSSCIIIIS